MLRTIYKGSTISPTAFSKFCFSLYHQPWPLSTVPAPILDSSEPVEEEKSPFYSPDTYYHAHLGEVLARAVPDRNEARIRWRLDRVARQRSSPVIETPDRFSRLD